MKTNSCAGSPKQDAPGILMASKQKALICNLDQFNTFITETEIMALILDISL